MATKISPVRKAVGMMVNSKNRLTTMKRSLKTWALIAAVALGLGACQNDIEEQVVVKNTRTVKFVTDSAENRTSVDTTGEKPAWAWNDEESFAVLECIDGEYYSEAEEVNFNKTADNIGEIEASFAFDREMGLEGAHYDYMIVHPESGFVSHDNDFTKGTLTLPAVQEMDGNSYDADADLMVSKEINWDTYCDYDVLPVQFTRLAAVVQLTIEGMVAGDKLESVTFTATGKDGKVIALAGEVTTDLTKPMELAPVEGKVSNSVTVSGNYEGNKVLFTTLPATLEAGDKYTVTAISEKKVYIKEGTIADGKSLSLKAGYVNRLTVKGVTPSDRWELVKDASTLKEGDVVAIAAKDYDFALSTKLYNNASETSTSARRDAVAISKMGDYLITNDNVQRFTLVTGSVDGTFAFYDESRGKFLVSNNGSSRYLINQPYISAETCFAISVKAEDGDATIKNKEGNYPDNMIRYYNSSKYFYSGTSANQAVCIYRLGGVVGDIPVVDANVTVPDEDEYVTIAEEGATNTAIEEVVFNYVGKWTITPSTTAKWLTVSYDEAKGQLTYTAEANTGAKREAIVTITATLEGKEDLTWKFTMTQKGAPQEISIAEFMTKGKDENTTYKLTGRITEMTSSSSGTYKLSDGTNVATITYLYTDGGDKVYGDDSIGLNVGDVMTVTTVVASTTKGKGGSSSYHSIYKGHYGLTAEASVAAGFVGGDVTITVTTYSNGTIALPAEVTAKCSENDFATFSYNGGNTATVSFPENTTSDSRAVDVTFTYGDTSVTVTAEQSVNPANKQSWGTLVTNASDLAVGDQIVFVAKNKNKVLSRLASSSSATGITNFPAVEVDKSGSDIYDVEKVGGLVFTLVAGTSNDTFALKFTHNSKDYYLYAPSSGLKGENATSTVDNDNSFGFTIDSTTGDAKVGNKRSTSKLVKFNGSTEIAFLAVSDGTTNATKDSYAICVYKKN